MIDCITDGVWPTMITPFTNENRIDYSALDELIEWYIAKHVDGLFAVCQSSEMFYLTLDERIELATHIVRRTGGILPVIACGNVSEYIEEQIDEANAMNDAGVAVVVLITNRLAKQDESDDIWKINIEKLLYRIDGPIGLYECPYPYKRLISPALLKWCAETKRIIFLKDTSCDIGQITAKLNAIHGTSLKLYNANAATLLASLKLGAAGFSGVMANIHPELYVWLTHNWQLKQDRAESLQAYLGFSSALEKLAYPINAKYFLQMEGLNISLTTRVIDKLNLTHPDRLVMEHFQHFNRCYEKTGGYLL